MEYSHANHAAYGNIYSTAAASAHNNHHSLQQHQQHQQHPHHQQQQQQQYLHHYNPSSSSSNGSSGGTNRSNHYQHQPLTNVFPSIYNEENNYFSGDQQQRYASDPNNYLVANGHMSSSSLNQSNHQTSSGGVAVPSASHYSNVQRQIQHDWTNREYIQVIISNIKKLTDFLNSFELSCKSKLAMLDEKLTKLERQIDYIEAKVTKGETLN